MSELQSRRLVLEFTKMTGAGNDFFVIDNRFYHFNAEELSELAQKFCPRKTAIGADGLLALEESPDPDLDFVMVHYNIDGSRSTMCGNGARCLSRFARMTGMTRNPLRFSTDAGVYSADIPENPSEDVILHLPPFANFQTNCSPTLDTGLDASLIDFIWTGTEHIVVEVEDVEKYPVHEIGSILRNDSGISENGANVNFVETMDTNEAGTMRLRVRTYERGVEAETMACGTGAVASAMVSIQNGSAEINRVEVVMNGGILVVRYDGDAANPNRIFLEGPADLVYRGTVEI